MSLVLEDQVRCAMCLERFDPSRARKVLSTRKLLTHDVVQCPFCLYYVTVLRASPGPDA
jgi:hypothetical protein